MRRIFDLSTFIDFPHQVLQSCGKASPEMTSALSHYGGGSMSNGIKKMWKHGQRLGRLKQILLDAVIAFLGLFGFKAYKNAKRKTARANPAFYKKPENSETKTTNKN